MRTAVDHDQVRIMWHWICENLKDPNFRAIAPKHYLDEPRRVDWAFDKLVEFERNFDAPYCVILGDCQQGNTYILTNGERLWLDLQLSRRGRPGRDLTYFCIVSPPFVERPQSLGDTLHSLRTPLVASGATNIFDVDVIV